MRSPRDDRPPLLVVSPWWPYPADNGSRLRAFFLLRELAKTYRVRLVAGAQADSPAETPAPLAALCESVARVPWVWHDGGASGGGLRALLSPVPRSVLETPNPAFTAAIEKELGRGPAAVLAMELGSDAYLPDGAFRLPVVLDQAEVSGLVRAAETASGWKAKARAGLTWAKGARYWGSRLRRYAAVTAVSEAEADAVRGVIGADGPPVVVIPNGTDVRAYTPRDAGRTVGGRLIYNGALTYGPNRDAVRWFASAILPKIAARVPEAHLLVTGRYGEGDADGLDPARVRLTDFLPDLRPTLAESAVCVVPLLGGGGTRLKILEAWAAGVPVVATTVGAAGLDGIDGTHLLLRDDADAFADAVVSLLTDSARGATLAENARRLAESRYDWTAVGATLTGLLTRVGAVNQPVPVT